MKQARKTPTVEQKQWMKENGYTEKQMDAFWAENVATNFVIRNLNSHGMSWRDMNLSVVSGLPTQKERDLEAIRKKEIEEKQKAEAEAKAKAEKEYYYEHFEEIMVKKILDGEKLSEKELREITDFEIDREEGANRRWSRTVTSILSMCGRYFALEWEEGLTEYQDNEYYNQPYEVVKKTYQQAITVTEWVKASNEVQ